MLEATFSGAGPTTSPASWKHRLSSRRAAWLQSLPDNLQDSATAEALRAIWISANFRRPFRHAASVGTDQPPPTLTQRDAQAPPAPFASRNAWGAALRARVPPMHDVDKLRIVPDEGSILDAKRGSELEAI